VYGAPTHPPQPHTKEYGKIRNEEKLGMRKNRNMEESEESEYGNIGISEYGNIEVIHG